MARLGSPEKGQQSALRVVYRSGFLRYAGVRVGDTLPGDPTRYLMLYWVWGLCAVGVLLGLAEYKTSPLRKGRERGHLFILLYIGSLLIVTRALNMFLYYDPY